MLPGELLLEKDPAPENGGNAVGTDDRGGKGKVRRIGQRVDVEELPDRFKDGSGEFRDLHLHHGFLFFNPVRVDRREDAHEQERQFVRDIGGILHELLPVPEQDTEGRLGRHRFVEQNETVGEGAERVKKAVDERDQDRDKALRVMVVGRVLAQPPKFLVLFGSTMGRKCRIV